jgi:hypothetical protein
MKKQKKVPKGQVQRRIIKELAEELGFKESTIEKLLNSTEDIDEATVEKLLKSDSCLKTAVLIDCLASDEKFADEYIKINKIPEKSFGINIRNLVRKADVKLKKI